MATASQSFTSLIPRTEAGSTRPLPPRPQPRPQIPEEDECWVCHRELPSRSLPNFEDLRSEHVESCIANAMQGSSSTPPPQTTSRNTPPQPTTSSIPPTMNTAASTPSATRPTIDFPSPAQTRRTGVFPYIATEKDCVDDAECTICLEEFEVGVEMGRLECFCRFHLKCVRDWFGSKPGQCPVHQHGGGF
jgi:Ring finger domain